MDFKLISKYTHLLAAAVVVLISFLALSNVIFNEQPVLVGSFYTASPSYWTTWWPHHALAGDYDLVYNNYTVFPIYSNLLPLLSIVTTVIHYPLRLIFGERAGFNLLVPLYMSLNAFSVYLLLAHHLQRRALALAAALIVAFNPVMLALAAWGQVALLGFWVVVVWLLLFERYMARSNITNLLLLAFGLYAVILTSMQFWNLIFTLLLPYAAYRVWEAKSYETHLRHFLVLFLIVSALAFLFPIPAILRSTYDPRYREIENWLGDVIIHARTWPAFSTVGVVLGIAALFTPWDALPLRRVWFAALALNLIGYLNPQLGPLSALSSLLDVPAAPTFTNEDVYLLPLILVGVVVIAQAMEFFLARFEGRYLWPVALGAVSIVAVLLVLDWWRNVPVTVVPERALYTAIADDPEDYLIAEIPIGVDSLARQQTAAARFPVLGFPAAAGSHLVNVPIHHKRIVGGLTAYHVAEDIALYDENPLLQTLLFQETGLSTIEQAEAIQNEARRLRLGYVVIDAQNVAPEFASGLRGWLAWTGSFCRVAEEGAVEYWRAAWHPAGCEAIVMDMSADFDFLAIGENWYPAEGPNLRWAGPEATSTLTLWSRPLADYHLSIDVSAPESQSLEVVVNGMSLGTQDITGETLTFDLPAEAVGPRGLLEIELRHAESQNIEGRQLTALYDRITLTLTD